MTTPSLEELRTRLAVLRAAHEAERAAEAQAAARRTERQRQAQVAARYLGAQIPLPVPPSVDWSSEWDKAPEETEWLAEPLVPARRSVSIYSAPKVGKSLILQDIAASLAAGRGVLGGPARAPLSVLYVDLENSLHDDVIPRLKAMGHEPADLERLHYLSFPDLAALDSPAGGEQIMRAVATYDADLVVVDTMSRTHDGEENSNDTSLAWHRYTGARLKAAGVALVRLDHSGHEGSHARGASAKAGDVDAIWSLTKVDDTHVRLKCDDARFVFAENDLTLERVAEPHLHHKVVPRPSSHVIAATKETERVEALDASDLDPATASMRDAKAHLREVGLRGKDEHLQTAIRVWRQRHGHADEDQS